MGTAISTDNPFVPDNEQVAGLQLRIRGFEADMRGQQLIHDNLRGQVDEQRRVNARLQATLSAVQDQNAALVADRDAQLFEAAGLREQLASAQDYATQLEQYGEQLREMVGKRNRMLKKLTKWLRRERRRSSACFRVNAGLAADLAAEQARSEHWQGLFISLHEYHQDDE